MTVPAITPIALDTRSVPEWIGKTPDTPPPPRVKDRVFRRYEGKCYLTGRKIFPGDHWDCDHIKAIINGGENRESNLAPALKDKPHKEKTRRDVREKSRAARKRQRHRGIRGRKRKMGYRRFDGSPVPPRYE
ncbi:MAG TPA: HNH endonuclease [Xanthobacteraceae bacterium]|nr:HNH endonuclease [Xanthobacteraceae bacterium]